MKLFISRWVFKHSTAELLLEWSEEQAMGWKMGAVSFSLTNEGRICFSSSLPSNLAANWP